MSPIGPTYIQASAADRQLLLAPAYDSFGVLRVIPPPEVRNRAAGDANGCGDCSRAEEARRRGRAEEVAGLDTHAGRSWVSARRRRLGRERDGQGVLEWRCGN